MKKINLIVMVCLLFLGLATSSCDKKDKEEEVSPNTSLLTAGIWQGSAVYLAGQELTEEDYEEFAQLGLNIKELTFKFERNGTYVETNKGQAAPGGKWEFINNERNILFDKGTDDETTVLISKLDEDEFFITESGLEFRFER